MKKSNRMISGLALIVMAALVWPSGLSAEEETEEGWVSLFNGKDLTGWIAPQQDHTWKVVDGVIDYEAQGGNLVTEREFEDYVFRFEWRFKRTAGPPYNAKVFNPDGTQKTDDDGKPMTQPIPNADSGIFVRGTGETQVNLWCWPCGSGQLWSYHRSDDPEIRKGALPKENADRPVGQWNEMEITMRGERIKAVLNGKTVIDTRMPGIPAKGPIVLQHHGGYNEKKKEWSAASALIQFRNLRVRELPKKESADESAWTPLFNGKDFDGWKFHFGKEGADNDGTFTIKDGMLICSGKPSGYMYTERSYSNYTLQLEYAFKKPAGVAGDGKFRGNSGCLIHIADKNALGVWPRSIEVQGMHRQMGLILPSPRDLKCERTLEPEARDKVLKSVGQFNILEVEVDGGDMVISLNGTVVSTVSDCELTEGPIGIQSENAETHWKNIRIRDR
jgi:hypothetical protein